MKLKAIIVLVAALSGCTPAQLTNSATASSEQSVAGAVLLVRTSRHLQVALQTATDLRAQDSRFTRFRVLVCGEAVDELKAGGPLEERIRAARSQGTAVVACELALTNRGVQRSALSQAVEVVPNAIAEALQLQADGWVSVEL